MVTQVEVARLVGVDVSTVNKILNKKPGPVFSKDTIRQVFQAAKSLGFDFGRLKYHHRRRFSRKESLVQADLVVYSTDGSAIEHGSASILEISPGGALLENIALPSARLPVVPFTVGIRPHTMPDDGELRGRVVRLSVNGTVALGIEFLNVHQNIERQLKRRAQAAQA